MPAQAWELGDAGTKKLCPGSQSPVKFRLSRRAPSIVLGFVEVQRAGYASRRTL